MLDVATGITGKNLCVGTMLGFNFVNLLESKGITFLIHDYTMNQGTQLPERGAVSGLRDPLYLPY